MSSATRSRSSRIIRLGLAGTVMSLLVGLLVLPSAAETAEGEQGRLSVASSPEVDTQISVGGYVRNTTRVDGLPLDAGAHEVCFTAPAGYLAPPCEAVDVAAGEDAVLDGAFELAAELDIVVEPAEIRSQISIGGIPRDVAPLFLPVAVGEHEVCAAPVAGYQEVTCQLIAVTAGQVEQVVFEFEPVQDDTQEPEPEPEPVEEPVEPIVGTTVELSGSATSARGPNWTAQVALEVTEAGEPVSGVRVSGVWDLGGSRSTCTTDRNGGCTLELSGLHNRDKDVTFTVDRLDGAAFDGPSVTIER